MAGITRTRKKIWDLTWVKNADGTPREFVVIKKFTYGDREAINDASMRLTPVSLGKEVTADNMQMVFDPTAQRRARLERGIVSWCILDEDNQEVALTAANIQELDPGYAEYIMSELEALNPERKSG